jgi:hypothetical protein
MIHAVIFLTLLSANEIKWENESRPENADGNYRQAMVGKCKFRHWVRGSGALSQPKLEKLISGIENLAGCDKQSREWRVFQTSTGSILMVYWMNEKERFSVISRHKMRDTMRYIVEEASVVTKQKVEMDLVVSKKSAELWERLCGVPEGRC